MCGAVGLNVVNRYLNNKKRKTRFVRFAAKSLRLTFGLFCLRRSSGRSGKNNCSVLVMSQRALRPPPSGCNLRQTTSSCFHPKRGEGPAELVERGDSHQRVSCDVCVCCFIVAFLCAFFHFGGKMGGGGVNHERLLHRMKRVFHQETSPMKHPSPSLKV